LFFPIQDNNSGENKTFSIVPKIHRPSSNERSFAARLFKLCRFWQVELI
jgi:hypothetical protein